jgi:hypothetical protein
LVVNLYIPHNRRTPLQAEEALGPISIHRVSRGVIPVALAKLFVHTHTPFLVSSPVAFKFLNVLVLNIADKLLAGR